jgi:23S rRNA (uracil1939-C5)-methyltransferase
MQHASDKFVADWKADIARRALAAQNISVDIEAVLTSPASSRRRAKFSGKRTKKGALVGFHARASDTIVEIPNCTLLTPGLLAFLPALRELTVMSASRKAEIGLTVTETLNGPDVHIDTDREITEDLRLSLAGWANENGVARLVWADEPIVMINPPVQKFAEVEVVPPAGAFLQATKHGEQVLQTAVQNRIGAVSKVVDLFAGSGTFSLPMAATAEVHAVEGLRDMMDALNAAWRKSSGLKQVTTETRDLFKRPLLPDELNEFDAAIIDPPRAGALAQIGELASSKLKKVCMVSCNPVTFARDARILIDAGFEIGPLTVVDQFRWSAHVELVALFTRT